MASKFMKSQLAQSFNQAAQDYDLHAKVQQNIAQRSLALLKHHLPKNRRVCLDLGCGTGQSGKHLAEWFDNVIGIDISPKMLSEAVKNNVLVEKKANMHFINADAERLPFQSASINCVYSSMALQWCEEPAHVMRELRRVLKPNGTAMLAILVDGSFAYLNQAWQLINRPSRLNRFYTKNHWLDAAISTGFYARAKQEVFCSEHSSVLEMLASIKQVGANVKRLNGVSHALTKGELMQLERTMRVHLEPNKKLRLDYKLLFLSLANHCHAVDYNERQQKLSSIDNFGVL